MFLIRNFSLKAKHLQSKVNTQQPRSYPRTGPLSSPLIDYNRKTKHFTPLGLTELVEKGKPRSNRLDNFLDPNKAPEQLKRVDSFVYFTGERELIDSLGNRFLSMPSRISSSSKQFGPTNH